MAFKKLFSGQWFSKGREPENRKEPSIESDGKENDLRQDPGELELSPEHPLNQLWTLYTERGQAMPKPYLSFREAIGTRDLSEPSAPLLPDDEVEKELKRLGMLVFGVAQRRLSKQQAEEGDMPPDLDARVQVFLTLSRVTAWVLIYPPSGKGAEVSRGMLEQALKSSHVSYGINQELLERLPGLPERYFHLFLVASGKPPLHGKDGEVIDLFSRSPVRSLMEAPSGQIDFEAQKDFQYVKKGDVICRIVQPTPCVDGKTVSGEVCYARTGQATAIPKGKNTALSEEGDCLIATREGHVEFSRQNFHVRQVMEIDGDVDVSLGDISYMGDVHVRGDVRSGSSIRATGNITVDGVIEACTIESGGDLVVKKGIQGNNRAIIHSCQNIYVRYLENSTLYARGNLEAECIVNCDVFCDRDVIIRSGRGVIIGGTICASCEVSANKIGAKSECRTNVILGGRPCEAFERDCLIQEIRSLEKELEKLEHHPDGLKSPKEIARLKIQISADKLKIRNFDKELEEPGDGEVNRREQIKGDMMYPGVEITIHNAYLRLNSENAMCTAYWKDGEIVLDS